MDYQWYPGHMARANRMMRENLPIIDLIIELTDARAPQSGRNPDIDLMSGDKGRIFVLNKSDLADRAVTDAWITKYRNDGFRVVCADSRKENAARIIMPLIEKARQKKKERDRGRGIKEMPVRVMVVGIPNVGKSTLINSLVHKAVSKTGARPGVTRGKQWIRIDKNVELLDTPGILWPRFEDRTIGIRLSLLGAIRDEITDERGLSDWLINYLMGEYPKTLDERYSLTEVRKKLGSMAFQRDEPNQGLSPQYNSNEVLELIAMRTGCIGRGNRIDLFRASAVLIRDFRAGRLGRISLEKPV